MNFFKRFFRRKKKNVINDIQINYPDTFLVNDLINFNNVSIKKELEYINISTPKEIQKLELLLKINLKQTELDNVFFFGNVNTFAIEGNKIVGLNLAQNKISDISFLLNFIYLKKLDLHRNRITNISIISNLLELEELNLQDNLISDISTLLNLKKIHFLDFNNNLIDIPINFFPKKDFPSLKTFRSGIKPLSIKQIEDILGYRISEEPLSAIYFSKSLTCFALDNFGKVIGFKLRYSNTSFSDISFLKILTDLEVLNLPHNHFQEVTLEFLNSFKKLQYLNIHDNPIRNVPKELFDRDINVLDDIKIYLKSLTGELLYLHQAKLVLVGNGEVGKSSIRIKLLDKNGILPKKEERTQGIEIAKYTIRNLSKKITKLKTNISFDLFIWDFGGQGKYREVQQLFCSRKALYIYVTSVDDKQTNEDYVGFEYWCSMVTAFGYDKNEDWQSPIIYVLNKCDLGKKAINEESVYDIFDNVHDFIKISCSSLENFDKLKESIIKALPKISKDVFTNQFNKKWFDVKDLLEKRKKQNHISLEKYKAICKSKDLNEAESNLWLDYLDRVGSLIYFRENKTLNNFIILNPLWVRDSMYKVLDSPLTKDGIFKEEYFQYIWHNYNSAEHHKLLALMLAYKFCYLQTDNLNNSFYIIPALLSNKRPVFPSFLNKFDYSIRFDYVPYIPAGTVNKLMVDLHKYIYQDLKWKNGCILHIANEQGVSYAEVSENWREKSVFLKIVGRNVNSIYNLIYNELVELVTDLKKIKFLDKLNIEVKANYKGDYITINTIRKFGIENKFWFLFSNEKTNSPLKSTNIKKINIMNNIPEFFVIGLNKQITEQYAEIVRYRYLKSNEKSIIKRKNYQEEIDLREINIKEIESQFMKQIQGSAPEFSQNEILVQIEGLKQAIFSRFDIVENDNAELLFSIESILSSINAQQIDENQYDRNKAEELLQEILKRIKNLDIPNKEALLNTLKGELSTGSKLKLTLPLIPGFLQYESDLIAFVAKEPIKNWKDLWNAFFSMKSIDK